ncbi:MAG: hypothetical protein ABI406_06755 [Ktedonobacteraceae bacterium]
MLQMRGEWLLWLVFIISLGLTVYSMVTRTQPTQQLMIIEILGLGCGLIAMMRRRSREREQRNKEEK